MPKKNGNSPDQFSLLGFDPPPQPAEPPLISAWSDARPLDPLFFALLVDAAAAERIKPLRLSLVRQHDLRGKLRAAERFHVSLAPVGLCLALTNSQVESAKKAASAIRLPSFTTQFGRVLSFSRGRDGYPFILKATENISEMNLLHKTLVTALRNAGLQIKAGSFTPHITLLYDQKLVAEQVIEPIELNVREFVLIHSHAGQSRYTELGRWPLQERP